MGQITTERLRDYRGPVTDTGLWEGFDLRPDDIIVDTPPKCGTTWMLNIVMMLILGRAVPDAGGSHSAPWLDCAFTDDAKQKAFLNGLARRRCIKSHSPLDAVPYAPEMTYIVVYRHPVDMHFSMRSFAENLKAGWFDHLFAGDDRDGFRRFLDGSLTEQGIDDLTAASLAQHYMAAKARASNGNVHFFHYTDLSRDLPAQITRLAEILGLPLDDALRDEIAEGTSFASMRKAIEDSPTRFAEDSPMHDRATFYHSASSGKWEGRLTDGDMAAYEARMADLLAPEDKAWLNWGDRRAP